MSHIPESIVTKRMTVKHIRDQFAWLHDHQADEQSFYELSGVVEFSEVTGRKRSEFLTKREFHQGWQKCNALDPDLETAMQNFINIMIGTGVTA